MSRTHLCAALATLTTGLIGPFAWANDVDEDGIDDSLEQTLIDMYRPWLYYDAGETIRPCLAEAFVRNSNLRYQGPNPHSQSIIVYNPAQLNDDPLLILNADSHPDLDLPPSRTTRQPGNVGFFIDVNDDFRDGPPGPPQPVGMYGHVVPLLGPLSYTNGPTLPSAPLHHSDVYLIQYWQLLPFNDFPGTADYGDHEGDWLWIDVLVDRDCPHELLYTVHHHHGDNECGGPTVQGGEFGPVGGSIFRLFPLPCDPENLANVPFCLLEANAHEWWPFPSGGGECDFAAWETNPSHLGNGDVVESQNVINLGERYAPMPGLEPALILFFNGLWGTSGGIHQMDPGFPFAPLFVAYVDPAAPPWTGEGLGSRYHPFRTLADGIEQVETGGRVRIDPGDYPGPYTFSRAMRLEREPSWVGTVIIGQ